MYYIMYANNLWLKLDALFAITENYVYAIAKSQY